MMDSLQTSDKSVGQTLVEARTRKGLTCEQVAQELNVQLDKLRALEEDNFDQLFSPVFVRGYIRSYAKLMKIDGEPLVAQYDAAHKVEDQPLPQSESLNVKIKTNTPKWPLRLLVIVVIIALWVFAYWYFADASDSSIQPQQNNMAHTNTPETSVQSPTSEPAQAEAESALDNERMGQPTADLVDVSETAVNQAIENDSTDSQAMASLATEPALATVTENAQPDTLQLAFEHDCWVNVTDATGDVLVAALQEAKTQLVVDGVGPFDITLGNASGVSVVMNSLPVTVPDAEAGKVIHFTAAATQ
ncbi:RodZ domain-containing protein [Gilvimarinus sp. 1_MG-2023]|uniref:RodZ domain-containing protein n=1 Tax=Gilvimarinus sp. 1_MG-2023 TaxID=3062638 RepID=UPI0026E2EF79|nr:RodZ domain-containing protein [Gilvimarinus sp. 1_MG-2023]MDO6746032.1 DUF4115 domain-containing protein [Gilvimarinus sp. 1_MG-2023]